MRGIRHPLSGAVYELEGDDTIVVSKDAKSGRFGLDGRWISGDIRHADPHLCQWVGGQRMMSRHRPVVRAGAVETGARS